MVYLDTVDMHRKKQTQINLKKYSENDSNFFKKSRQAKLIGQYAHQMRYTCSVYFDKVPHVICLSYGLLESTCFLILMS